MKLPLPIEDGWSLIATCRSRRELVELLAALPLETGAPEAVTPDDYAMFRADCRRVLPSQRASDAVPIAIAAGTWHAAVFSGPDADGHDPPSRGTPRWPGWRCARIVSARSCGRAR
jgi:hypothetical protein